MELHCLGIIVLLVAVFGNICEGTDLDILPPNGRVGDGPRPIERSLNSSAEELAKSVTKVEKGTGVQRSRIPQNMLSMKPEMFQTFYIFLGISFILVLLIVYRMFKLRSHRAERRYGVQGDKSAQELTPLPSAMLEDESDLDDDDIVFDINKTRVYVP